MGAVGKSKFLECIVCEGICVLVLEVCLLAGAVHFDAVDADEKNRDKDDTSGDECFVLHPVEGDLVFNGKLYGIFRINQMTVIGGVCVGLWRVFVFLFAGAFPNSTIASTIRSYASNPVKCLAS
mgnify:CR=1 FL=1